jgi:hypothetical protein
MSSEDLDLTKWERFERWFFLSPLPIIIPIAIVVWALFKEILW